MFFFPDWVLVKVKGKGTVLWHHFDAFPFLVLASTQITSFINHIENNCWLGSNIGCLVALKHSSGCEFIMYHLCSNEDYGYGLASQFVTIVGQDSSKCLYPCTKLSNFGVNEINFSNNGKQNRVPFAHQIQHNTIKNNNRMLDTQRMGFFPAW